MDKNIKKNTLKKRVLNLVNGWECLENQLKELPKNHPMRIVVPAIATCRKQLDSTIKDKKLEGIDFLKVE
ncbi:MAG: hypothetical protein M0Q13_15435 [Methanothrix sp.]|jgi:hypothetical protein|nr:hypothetical protein [Methanothrix sp.]